MKLLNIIVLIILTVILSCKENKNASATKSATPQPEQTVTPAPAADSLMKVIISFYSIGEGIDRGQTEKLMAYLQSYEKKAGNKIEYSEIHWGREGETDFCFPFAGYSDKQVTDFIAGAKEALNTAEHVHFLQNQVCRKSR
jgi:hypothetical protein